MRDTAPEIAIRPEGPGDAAAVAGLCARAFGPGRFARTAYRLREGAPPVQGLGFTVWRGGAPIGAIRFTEVELDGAPGCLLLGPLVIDPAHAGQGWGRKLIARGLAAARERGFRLVLLVGDLDYYARAGFRAVPPGRVLLPGPVDPARLLAAELAPGALDAARGTLRRPGTVLSAEKRRGAG